MHRPVVAASGLVLEAVTSGDIEIAGKWLASRSSFQREVSVGGWVPGNVQSDGKGRYA